METLKDFFTSRSLIRFYRVIGYGVLSLIVVYAIDMLPSLNLSPDIILYITTTLTAIGTAIDKKIRDLKSKTK